MAIFYVIAMIAFAVCLFTMDRYPIRHRYRSRAYTVFFLTTIPFWMTAVWGLLKLLFGCVVVLCIFVAFFSKEYRL